MTTLYLLAAWCVIGTILSGMLLMEGAVIKARLMFLHFTVTPICILLFLIVIIGLAPIR